MDMGANELLIILAIVVILFGAKKIPDLAKGLGQGIKDFKKAVKEDEKEDVSSKSDKIEGKETNKEPVDTKETTKV